MEVMARVLGCYGRNRDQQTCVCQRSAFDEISHDRAGTCDQKPPGFTFDHHRIDPRCPCLPLSFLFFETSLGTLIPSRPPFSTKTASLEVLSSHDPHIHRAP